MVKDRRACITFDTFLVRTVLLSIPWSTEVGSSFLGFFFVLVRVNPFHGFPLCVMAFDVVFNPDTGIGILPGVDRYAPQAGQTGLDESVGAGEGFAFFSGLQSFEILGEDSDRDVDLSLSLSSSPFLCPYFSGLPQPVSYPHAEVSVGFDCTAPH